MAHSVEGPEQIRPSLLRVARGAERTDDVEVVESRARVPDRSGRKIRRAPEPDRETQGRAQHRQTEHGRLRGDPVRVAEPACKRLVPMAEGPPDRTPEREREEVDRGDREAALTIPQADVMFCTPVPTRLAVRKFRLGPLG